MTRAWLLAVVSIGMAFHLPVRATQVASTDTISIQSAKRGRVEDRLPNRRPRACNRPHTRLRRNLANVATADPAARRKVHCRRTGPTWYWRLGHSG